MPRPAVPLFDRPDTMFGVCEGVGEALGFNANWLRIVLGAGLLWDPIVVLSAYVVLGIGVAASRWFWPVATPKAAPAVGVAAQAAPAPFKMAA